MRLESHSNVCVSVLAWLALACSAQAQTLAPLPSQPADVPFPTEQWPQAHPGAGVDGARLEAALKTAFAAKSPAGVSDTRAVLVVQHGAIVVERYAPGFNATRRFESGSMAKTITQGLVAILVRQGRLDVTAHAPIAAWQKPDDSRSQITLDQLLRMKSGLDNADDAGEGAFLPELLFGAGSRDVFSHAVQSQLAHPPGTYWAYSTATSVIVTGIVNATVRGGRDGMLNFMREELFGPLGMRSAEPEFDAAGTEPPRNSRRLQMLRGWSHGKEEQAFGGGSGACGSACGREPGRACVGVGGDQLGRWQAWLRSGDAAQVGAAGPA